MDLKDLGPKDPHTLYYLGVTHLSALDAMLGVGTSRTAYAKSDVRVFTGE